MSNPKKTLWQKVCPSSRLSCSAYPGLVPRGSTLSRTLSVGHLHLLFSEDSEAFQSNPGDKISLLCPKSAYGHSQNTWTGRHPECPGQTSKTPVWPLFLMWKSRDPTLSPFQLTELLILFKGKLRKPLTQINFFHLYYRWGWKSRYHSALSLIQWTSEVSRSLWMLDMKSRLCLWPRPQDIDWLS